MIYSTIGSRKQRTQSGRGISRERKGKFQTRFKPLEKLYEDVWEGLDFFKEFEGIWTVDIDLVPARKRKIFSKVFEYLCSCVRKHEKIVAELISMGETCGFTTMVQGLGERRDDPGRKVLKDTLFRLTEDLRRLARA